MSRIISPPKDQFEKLRQPLTNGERLVFDFFDVHAPQAWELYVQPHLNGTRPDFVLLNPDVGIAVYEVKDWDLDAMDRWLKPRSGRPPQLMGRIGGKEFSLQNENPVDRVLNYKEEIEDLYCPRLKVRAGYVVITAGVIFPFADDNQLQKLFMPSRWYHGLLEYPQYFPIVGRNALRSGNITCVFPEAIRTSSKHMTAAVAQDLRNWLVEPDTAATQRNPLELDANQKALATSRTSTGYRRIKGPAGSGKSLVLAARAAQLIAEGKKVLVVSYNITLIHYLMDLAVRWPHGNGNTRRDVTWLNFHTWCKRVCQEAGRKDEYDSLWKRAGDSEERHDGILRREIPRLVASVLEDDAKGVVTRYDAVLVDEGQDFLPLWWTTLRKVCREGGEMLLVADATQDTYQRAVAWPDGAWTDGTMADSGFSGRWARLQVSYRTPLNLTALTRAFAERYLPEQLRDLPSAPQLELNLDPCKLRWVQTDKEHAPDICLREILDLARAAEPGLLSMSDIVLLVSWLKSGREIVARLNQIGINVVHTFAREPKERRKQKVGFYMGDARLKATTLHSFKGWEARAVVLYVERAKSLKELTLVYSGITRLKRHDLGSFLTVICAEPNLASYGRIWPEYEVLLPS